MATIVIDREKDGIAAFTFSTEFIKATANRDKAFVSGIRGNLAESYITSIHALSTKAVPKGVEWRALFA